MAAVSRETGAPNPEVLDRLFGSRAELARQYAELLGGPGIERGLLGPREAPRVWQRHILNCAVITPALSVGVRVCDLGSGAGLPGIVLALARPDVSVILLEPLLRRTRFLSEVVDRLGLENATVRRGRAEELTGAHEFDVVTARAVAPLGTLIDWGMPLLRPGGQLIAFKGETAAAELAAAAPRLRRWGVRHAEIEVFGIGMVEQPTTVIRLESSRTRPSGKKGSS